MQWQSKLLRSTLSSDMDSTYTWKTPIYIYYYLLFYLLTSWPIFTIYAHPQRNLLFSTQVPYFPMVSNRVTITYTRPMDKLSTGMPTRLIEEAWVVLSLLFLSIL